MSKMKNYSCEDLDHEQRSLEMFRRAVLQGDQHARDWLQRRYCATMQGCMHSHPRLAEARLYDSESNYISSAFERLWQTTDPDQEAVCSTLNSALRYLYACLNAAILDTLRAHQLPKEASMSEIRSSSSNLPEAKVDRYNKSRQLWETISNMLPSTQEQRLAYLLFHCGLKPGEIALNCPEEFSDIEEIYRLRLSIFQRLQSPANQISALQG